MGNSFSASERRPAAQARNVSRRKRRRSANSVWRSESKQPPRGGWREPNWGSTAPRLATGLAHPALARERHRRARDRRCGYLRALRTNIVADGARWVELCFPIARELPLHQEIAADEHRVHLHGDEPVGPRPPGGLRGAARSV